jgi:hypothetical protein
MQKPIFSEDFLSRYLADFVVSTIPNIREIVKKIQSLNDELNTGKLNSLKEEEIKSRFIYSFFGDILGFNYGNSKWWQLREEKKTVIDGKKADAALGYFTSDKTSDNVRIIVEIKDANVNLDEKQNRTNNNVTPVEQAFSYAPKMGGYCRWVVVSNMKETRFYCSNDEAKYQAFFLNDLINEKKRNELLFLFHKDRFIKRESKSPTDLLLEKSIQSTYTNENSLHIIDEIYKCLKRFDGFGFVDPEYICSIYPFNILEDHVWHYHKGKLFTLNSEIYSLLEELTIEDGNDIVFSEKLKSEITKKNVIDAEFKVNWSLRFLNNCSIICIAAVKNYRENALRNTHTLGFSLTHEFGFKEGVDGITKDIRLTKKGYCDCISCNYRNLRFANLIAKLKKGLGNKNFDTREYAFGNYLVASNNFKTTYTIYKEILKETKGKEGKEVEYFLTQMNIKLLHNLIKDYDLDDKSQIVNDIKSTDLDKVIYDEIEFSVDAEVKNYLIDVKEDALIYKVQDRIESLNLEISRLKESMDAGTVQHLGPDLPGDLIHQYYLLYSHINRNYIIYDIFSRYKSLTEKIFRGLVNSYLTPRIGLQQFNIFIVIEAILHIPPENLRLILSEIEILNTEKDCIPTVLEKLNNFTSSYFTGGIFGDPIENILLKEHLNYFRFENRFTDIFRNLFIVLLKLDIRKNDFLRCVPSLLNYLKTETELSWADIEPFRQFVLTQGSLFSITELHEILKLSIKRHKYGFHKYTKLIESTAEAIYAFYPDFKIENVSFIRQATSCSYSDEGNHADLMHLIPIANICGNDSKDELRKTFESELDKNFNYDLYEQLIRNDVFSFDHKTYFQVYAKHINRIKGGRAYSVGKDGLTNIVLYNFAAVVYALQIDFERKELALLTKLNDFEAWLLNPIKFDYSKFDAKWMEEINYPIFLSRLKGNRSIGAALEMELKKQFNPVLAKIKYKYFLQD